MQKICKKSVCEKNFQNKIVKVKKMTCKFRKNKYELAVAFSAKLEDDERAATIEKVKNMITRHGGTITNVDEWGKKRLAYEVRKMREAFYYFIQFDGEATVPAEVESRIRLMENVVRYLCVRQDEK